MKKATEAGGQPAANNTIKTIAALKAVIEKPLICRFTIDGQPVEIPVRRMTCDLDTERRRLINAAIPPFVKERNDYDMLNPQYRAQRELNEDMARSYLIYNCCDEVAAGRPGLKDPTLIHNYVKGLLDVMPPTVLEMIALTAMAGGLDREVAHRANFTFTPGLES